MKTTASAIQDALATRGIAIWIRGAWTNPYTDKIEKPKLLIACDPGHKIEKAFRTALKAIGYQPRRERHNIGTGQFQSDVRCTLEYDVKVTLTGLDCEATSDSILPTLSKVIRAFDNHGIVLDCPEATTLLL